MSFTVYTVTLLTTPEATEEHDEAIRAALKAAVAPLDTDPLIEVDEHHDC
jgi:hypothetical protein